MPSGRPSRGYVLRGEHVSPVRPARMSSNLETTEFVREGYADPRLVDPHLEAVVEQAAMEARARGFRAGHSAGYEAGRQEGLALLEEQRRRAAAQDAAEREGRAEYLQALVGSVETALAQAVQVHTPTLEQMYDLIASTAVELAESLVGHHLEFDGHGALDAVRRGMDVAPKHASATIRLNPADVALVEEHAAGRLDWGQATLVADPSVERCGALIQVDDLEIDAQYGPALERVRQVIR